LGTFEKRTLNILGPKREALTGSESQFRYWELHNVLQSALSNVKMTKYKRMH